MKKFVCRDVTLAGLLAVGVLPVWAQQAQAPGANPGTLQRSIENAPALPKAEKPVTPESLDLSDLSPIAKLLRVDVRDQDGLASAFQSYWADKIGQPVTVEQLAEFKIWANDEAKENGLYAFAQTETEPAEGGEVLVVTLVVPRIKSVRVYVPDEDLAKRYETLLTTRFAKDFAPGNVVDPNGLDQRLEAASFDLPVSLEIVIRSAGPNLVDLVVNVSPLPAKLGELSSGVLQLNNYGLKSYGRPQVMGMVSVGGFTPNAMLNLSAQVSDGVRYGRAEYEAPVEAYAARMKIYGSRSDSHTILGGDTASKGVSQETGLGLTHLWGSHKSYIFKTVAELGGRQTISRLALDNSETGRVEESQLRLTWSMDNDRVAREPSRLAVTLTAGEYTRLGGNEANNVETGGYTKLNATGRVLRYLSRNGDWQAVGRFSAQVASRTLDGYNRIALGGVNGVRAYTAADGVGDQGLVVSAELNRRLSSSQSVGVFYDAGRVRPNKNKIEGGFNTTYSLQAVGAQWTGNVGRWYYNTTLAKGIGGYKQAEDPTQVTESPRNPWRLSAALSYVF
jgi:hemolysin activation/secretion protein